MHFFSTRSAAVGKKCVFLHLERDNSRQKYEDMRIKFIINPISGSGWRGKKSIPEKIEKYLDHDQFDYDIVYTERAGHASELATQFAKEGIDIVVAVGGDGTVNEVARSLTHTGTALAIIPCGSGNGLARHLQIPLDVSKDIELINECEIHSLDYGVINGLPFFCTCGMGFDAFISMKFAESGKRGPISYVENVLKTGLSYEPETYTIEDRDGVQRYKAFLVACANASQYGNNAVIAPQASMEDGLIDVVIMEPFNALEAPQISIDLFNKSLDQNSKIKTFKTDRLHVVREKPGVIHYDGEPIITDQDVDIHIEKGGIKVIVNPEAKPLDEPNPLLNAFSEFFNNVNSVREDIEKQSRRVKALNKILLRKLNKL